MHKKLNHIHKIIFVLAVLFLPVHSYSQILDIRDNAAVQINGSSVMHIDGSADIGNNANLKLNGNIFISGDISNNGNMTSASGTVRFRGSGNSTISGTGTTTFNSIILEKDNGRNDTLLVVSNSFNVPQGFLQLLEGLFRLSGTFAINNTFFSLPGYSIVTDAGFWLDNPNAILQAQGSDVEIYGLFKITDGTANFGVNLLYESPSIMELAGGETNVENGFYRLNNNSTVDFTMYGGILNMGTTGGINSNNRGLFDIGAAGSIFNWSGGTIEMRNTNTGSFAGDYFIASDSGNVTGGTLRINAAAGGQTIDINTVHPVGELFMTGTNNPVARIRNNDLSVLNDITIDGTGNGRLNANNQNIFIGGDWINSSPSGAGAFTPTNSFVTFNGAADQSIIGTGASFNSLYLDKSGGDLIQNIDVSVDDSLKFISESIIDLNQNDLVISEDGVIASLTGSEENDFNTNKCVFNSESAGSYGGRLIRKVNAGTTSETNLVYPMGTPGEDYLGNSIDVYTPAEVILLANEVTFSADNEVAVQPIPEEHPKVERTGISLTKYWKITSENISYTDRSVTVFCYYDSTEVEGSVGNYEILYFSPPDPANGFWRVDPGRSNNIVEIDDEYFFSQEVDSLDGDWTAGLEDAGKATYFSRADGNYNDPNTWSKSNFGGPPSTTIPNKRSDKVRIRNNTVTIPAGYDPAEANLVSIEEAVVPGNKHGELIIEDNSVITGDTLRLEANTTLQIGHEEGINRIANTGAVQTIDRIFHEEAIYKYIGNHSPQYTGDALPSPPSGSYITKFIVDKPAGDTLKLSKDIRINDSLIINSGIFDLDNKQASGNGTGKSLSMPGTDSELIVRQSFPPNFAIPSFTAGTVTFDGQTSVTIPSSGSTPGVAQYNNLKISAPADNPRSGNISFNTLGRINIGKDFDISGLNFDNNSRRFITDNSTVAFNRNDGQPQTVPFKPSSPNDSLVNLSYYNLILDSSGTKNVPAIAYRSVIANDITIKPGVTLNLNGSGLEIKGDWINEGGNFVHNNNEVVFFSQDLSVTNTILSDNTANNPFYNIYIEGEGNIEPADNMMVEGDLIISGIFGSGNLVLTNTDFTVQGDWTNNNPGSFEPGTSTVYLNGSALQSITKSGGNEEFYNLIIDNNSNIEFTGSQPDEGLLIRNGGEIEFINGYLTIRGYHATILGAVIRTGGTGHIDGETRKYVASGDTTVIYEIGYGAQYTPIELDINGSGGTGGLVEALSDTITTATSPISWSNPTPDAILPLGNQMSRPRHVARQWTLSIPNGSPFYLDTGRTYDATFNFIGGGAPNGDLRNGADPTVFSARLLYGASQWLQPDRFTGIPGVGNKTATSTEFEILNDFGTFIIGEPGQVTFFSLGGDWTDPTSWSQIKYGGPVSAIAPDDASITGNNPQVFIGDGKTITLNSNQVINTSDGMEGSVTIDSSGTLMTESNIISGTGGFYLKEWGTLGIGDDDGILDTPASDGNIQTSTREYNYNNHNRGRFIYTGNSAVQEAGSGLPATPDTVSYLAVDKGSGELRLSANVSVLDSLNIIDGTLSLTLAGGGNASVTLDGNLNAYSGGDLDPANGEFVFTGDDNQFILNETGSELQFYDITINKVQGAGNVILRENSPIQIVNNGTLAFHTDNYGLMDARDYAGNYVTGYGSDPIDRFGIGHVRGELRKEIPSGGTPNIIYEVGDSAYYTPYYIDFDGGGGTTGLLGVQVIPGEHPHITDANSPIAPGRYIPRYWRVTRPPAPYNDFERGGREIIVECEFINPDDVGLVDAPGCVDMAFWRGDSSPDPWQEIYKDNDNSNYSAPYSCGDTRFNIGSISYNGSSETSVQVNDLSNGGFPFGSSETLSDGSLLLGEFVLGNQNSDIFHSYYSIADGDWTDPNTWSTQGYGGSINTGTYPQTQYETAFIGNGKRVVLDENIGHNRISHPFDCYANAGPSVYVEDSGNLAFGVRVLRGNGLTVKKGGTIEIGSAEGFGDLSSNQYWGRGNILTFSRTFEDSINVIYTAEGYTPDFTGKWNGSLASNALNYCFPDYGANGGHLIENVTIEDQSNNILMENFTGTSQICANNRVEYYYNKSAVVEVGQTYNITMDPRNQGGGRRWQVWIDWDRDTDFQTDELVINSNFSSNAPQTASFTVPNSGIDARPGLVRMRVILKQGGGNSNNACASHNGEAEDYNLVLINNNFEVVQESGNGMPDNLYSLQLKVPASRTQPSQFELLENVRVRDSVKIERGYFNAGTRNIFLAGDFINNFAGGFNAENSLIEFYKDSDQEIRGTDSVTFNNIRINKDDGTVTLVTSANISGDFDFDSDNHFVLNDNTLFRFNETSTLSASAGDFGIARKFRSSGGTNSGILRREVPTGGTGNKDFLLPIGIQPGYNSMFFRVSGDYSGLDPWLEMRLIHAVDGHPQRINPNALRKYWVVSTNDISAFDSLNLRYRDPQDVIGSDTSYIPALYKTNYWQIDFGEDPLVDSDSDFIAIGQTSHTDGDWTAGQPPVFVAGRKYYSISSGDWSVPTNWSSVDHTGEPASYYPGELFQEDSVFIDGGDIIDYNLKTINISLIGLGATNTVLSGISGATGTGSLNFSDSPPDKAINIYDNIYADNNGAMNPALSGIDTMYLYADFINTTSGGGIDLRTDANNYTLLSFEDSGDSDLSGNGLWNDFSKIRINKSDPAYKVTVSSASFANATNTVPADYRFLLQSGTLEFNQGGSSMALSAEDDVILEPSSRLSVLNGTVATPGNLFYKTGSEVSLASASAHLEIGESFARLLSGSRVDFSMAGGEVKVLTNGDPASSYIGFDVTNDASSFFMDGGTIIISNANTGAPSDFYVSQQAAANGGGMQNGAIIQSGETGVTSDAAPVKIAGTMDITQLDVVGHGTDPVTTNIAENILTITDELNVQQNNTVDLIGNTIELLGDMNNYGEFNPASGLLLLSGDSNLQTIVNDNSPTLDIYNLRIDKTGDPNQNSVLLGNDSTDVNSNIRVYNSLEFSDDNQSIINSAEYGRYVMVSNPGTGTQVLRNGEGHVYGRLYRYIGAGSESIFYPVGGDSLEQYRPVTFTTTSGSTGQTAGNVGVRNYNYDHPDIHQADIDTTSNFMFWWNVNTGPAPVFALGNRTFALKTEFRNPEDLRDPADDPLLFEHHMRNPSWEDDPVIGGNWTLLPAAFKSDTTITSLANTEFGDFLAAEPEGETFYSYSNGNWNNVNTWSLDGYTIKTTPVSRIPDQFTDRVFIGNGKKVNVPASMTPKPEVRSVIVEKDPVPGILSIEGQLGYIGGSNFVLEDSATLEIQHIQGINPNIDVNDGAIWMNTTRSFGISNYVYDRNDGSQRTGEALPDRVASIISDNSSVAGSNRVFITRITGAPPLEILDSIYIRQGELITDEDRETHLFGDFILSMNGAYTPGISSFAFKGANDKIIMLRNENGLQLYDLNLDGGNVSIIREDSAGEGSSVYIENQLNFNNDMYVFLGRGQSPADTAKLVINNADTSAISGYSPSRFVVSRRDGGYLSRAVSSQNLPLTYTYPVGSYENSQYNYAPALFEGQSGTTAGFMNVKTNPGDFQGNFPDGHSGLSSNPGISYLTRYWSINGVTAEVNGQWAFIYSDNDISGSEADLSRIGRWRPVGEETPGSWAVIPENPGVNILRPQNMFLTDNNYDYTLFMGDWTLGSDQAFRRIFYSRQTGAWNDFESWTFRETHQPSDPVYGAGVFPNDSQDSVVIGGGHEIALTQDRNIGGIAVGHTAQKGILNLGEFVISGEFFTLGDSSKLMIGSPFGITNLPAMQGNVQTSISRNYTDTGVNAVFEYTGTQNQTVGDGLPASFRSLIISNTGPTGNNTVTVDRDYTILQDLFIDSGRLDLRDHSADKSSIEGDFRISADASIRIGGDGTNLNTAINNYFNYNVDIQSITEFYGDNQIISTLPANLTGGLGNVLINNAGTKIVDAPLLIRSNLTIDNNALLINNAGVNSLEVYGNVNNNANVNNEGVIEIGN
ncbi:MAG: GEVED domain-containing protein [Candidatus Kapaibacterium sp.]